MNVEEDVSFWRENGRSEWSMGAQELAFESSSDPNFFLEQVPQQVTFW